MTIRLRRIGPAGTLLLIAVLAGCDDAPAGDPGSLTTRDSAGIRIVQPTEPLWEDTEAWRLRAEPLLHVGDDDHPSELLYRVSDATRLSDGRVAVLNSGTAEVRLFGPRGDPLGVLGGEGEGPGELRYPTHLERRVGDTLVVWDIRRPRSVFAPDGSYLRSVRFNWDSVNAALGPDHFTEMIHPLPGGRVAFSVYESHSPGEPLPNRYFEPFRPTHGFFLTDTSGSDVDTLGWYGGILQRLVDAGPPPLPVVAFFSPLARVAGDGDPLRIYTGDSASPRVRTHDGDGELLFLLDLPIEPVRVSEEDVAAERERREEGIRQSDWPERLRRRQLGALAHAPTQETFPLFDDLAADSEGRLWVEEYSRPGLERPRWWIFARDGTWLGTVEFPRDLEVFEIGEDYVLGEWRDELDVEHVLLYELIKPSA